MKDSDGSVSLAADSAANFAARGVRNSSYGQRGFRDRSLVAEFLGNVVPRKVALNGVVTSLKEEHENSASRIFSNDRDCLAPHVHSRRAKGSVRPCRNEMTLDVERVVGDCVS